MTKATIILYFLRVMTTHTNCSSYCVSGSFGPSSTFFLRIVNSTTTTLPPPSVICSSPVLDRSQCDSDPQQQLKPGSPGVLWTALTTASNSVPRILTAFFSFFSHEGNSFYFHTYEILDNMFTHR